MRKLVSISVVAALLVTFMVPTAVGAEYLEPGTYAKTPFAVMAAGLELLGDILDMLETKLGILGFDAGQFMYAIAGFTYGPLSWTVDLLSWGLLVLENIATVALEQLAPEYLWIADILAELVEKFGIGFGELYT